MNQYCYRVGALWVEKIYSDTVFLSTKLKNRLILSEIGDESDKIENFLIFHHIQFIRIKLRITEEEIKVGIVQ